MTFNELENAKRARRGQSSARADVASGGVSGRAMLAVSG